MEHERGHRNRYCLVSCYRHLTGHERGLLRKGMCPFYMESMGTAYHFVTLCRAFIAERNPMGCGAIAPDIPNDTEAAKVYISKILSKIKKECPPGC